MLILIGAWQALFYVAWRGWPFSLDRGAAAAAGVRARRRHRARASSRTSSSTASPGSAASRSPPAPRASSPPRLLLGMLLEGWLGRVAILLATVASPRCSRSRCYAVAGEPALHPRERGRMGRARRPQRPGRLDHPARGDRPALAVRRPARIVRRVSEAVSRRALVVLPGVLLALLLSAPAARAGGGEEAAPPTPTAPPGPWDRGVRAGGDVGYAPTSARRCDRTPRLGRPVVLGLYVQRARVAARGGGWCAPTSAASRRRCAARQLDALRAAGVPRSLPDARPLLPAAASRATAASSGGS